jgi:hypothetical protein
VVCKAAGYVGKPGVYARQADPGTYDAHSTSLGPNYAPAGRGPDVSPSRAATGKAVRRAVKAGSSGGRRVHYRLLGGGGGGFGVPVVSYAPRPMFDDSHSRIIIASECCGNDDCFICQCGPTVPSASGRSRNEFWRWR